jgi:hypothetical protein
MCGLERTPHPKSGWDRFRTVEVIRKSHDLNVACPPLLAKATSTQVISALADVPGGNRVKTGRRSFLLPKALRATVGSPVNAERSPV